MKTRFAFIFIVLFKVVQPANILCVFSTVSHSHFLFAETLLVELSRRGHNVTVFSEYARQVPQANYTAIVIPANKEMYKVINMFADGGDDKLIVLRGLLSITDILKISVHQTINHPELQKIRKHGNFDAVITEAGIGDMMLGLAVDLNCPNIQVLSTPPTLSHYQRMGNPLSLSYVRNTYISSSGEPMGFSTRLTHFIVSLFEMGVFNMLDRSMSTLYNQNFEPPKYPSMHEMRRNVSLMLLNTHFSQGIVRPLVPAIIEVSGMHVMPAAPLPTDLAEFMNNSKNGVILFSMGTNVKRSILTKQQISIFMNTFGRLKENVLWKIDESVESLPPNVKIAKWLPQNDLLAHSNLKLFITHGGLGSIVEAKCNGIPLVLLPVFGDQFSNSEEVVDQGWGRQLNFGNLTEHDFRETVNDVLINSTYRERAKYLARLYLDRPQTAMETAAFWVEYVIRHKGARHLQSNARHLNFLQLHSIDVLGFLFGCLLIIGGIIYIAFRFLISVCCTQNLKNKTKSE